MKVFVQLVMFLYFVSGKPNSGSWMHHHIGNSHAKGSPNSSHVIIIIPKLKDSPLASARISKLQHFVNRFISLDYLGDDEGARMAAITEKPKDDLALMGKDFCLSLLSNCLKHCHENSCTINDKPLCNRMCLDKCSKIIPCAGFS